MPTDDAVIYMYYVIDSTNLKLFSLLFLLFLTIYYFFILRLYILASYCFFQYTCLFEIFGDIFIYYYQNCYNRFILLIIFKILKMLPHNMSKKLYH